MLRSVEEGTRIRCIEEGTRIRCIEEGVCRRRSSSPALVAHASVVATVAVVC